MIALGPTRHHFLDIAAPDLSLLYASKESCICRQKCRSTFSSCSNSASSPPFSFNFLGFFPFPVSPPASCNLGFTIISRSLTTVVRGEAMAVILASGPGQWAAKHLGQVGDLLTPPSSVDDVAAAAIAHVLPKQPET